TMRLKSTIIVKVVFYKKYYAKKCLKYIQHKERNIMSDRVTKALASFSNRITYDNLSADVIKETKRRLIDTLGCLMSGYYQDATVAARKLAKQYKTATGATLIGTKEKVHADIATLTDGTAVRYLDFND